MNQNNHTLLCRYHYDPLDRMSNCAQASHDSAQRFYLKDRLITEIQGVAQRSVFQHENILLAQQRRGVDGTQTILVASDLQRSVLNELDADGPHSRSYTPYGHRNLGGLLGLLGFNGERPDPVTGHYLLGNGYRAFNPLLMRFNSPDSLSPFGKGGLNAYAYCVGDPVNRVDPNGHTPFALKALFGLGKRTTPPPAPRQSTSQTTLQLISTDSPALRESSYKQVKGNSRNNEIGMIETEINKIYDEGDIISSQNNTRLKAINNPTHSKIERERLTSALKSEQQITKAKMDDLSYQLKDLEARYEEIVGPVYTPVATNTLPSYDQAVANIRNK